MAAPNRKICLQCHFKRWNPWDDFAFRNNEEGMKTIFNYYWARGMVVCTLYKYNFIPRDKPAPEKCPYFLELTVATPPKGFYARLDALRDWMSLTF